MNESFSFSPSVHLLAESNLGRFMKKHAITEWRELLQRANGNIEWYWDAVNEDLGIEWFRKYDRIYDSSDGIPWTRWFLHGRCNIISNSIDRHAREHPEKVAYIFANEYGSAKVTFRELDENVTRLAGALANAGITKGDVVGIYLPMIKEAFYSIFACSKIGAVHTTVFSGFSAQALRSRLVDSNAKMLVTADSIRRRGKNIDLKSQWMKSIDRTAVSKVITTGDGDGKTVLNYQDFANSERRINTRVMDSEDPLFILFTSGTTGQPKGTLQVHGGFTVVAAQQAAYLIDMKPDDVLFWYADIGWITGQVWTVYGSTIIGGTSVVYEDALDHPDMDAWCRLIQNHKVTIFGAAPTAIRSFMKSNVQTAGYDFSALRILAATGEPINKEAWEWYFEKVGGKRCPVINLSGGTEIGGAVVSALPIMPLKPCTVGCPVPGFDADVFDHKGQTVTEGEGYLVIKKPWPSMTRGLLDSKGRFIETYWSKYENVWYHADIVLVDSDGLWYMRGRADDVMKVSGHRISSAEIEQAAASHPGVAEAVAVGKPDKLKGERIVVCVVLKDGYSKSDSLIAEIKNKVENSIGRFARPEDVRVVKELPRTRTGKLVRRLVRSRISGGDTGQELSTVENPSSLDGLL